MTDRITTGSRAFAVLAVLLAGLPLQAEQDEKVAPEGPSLTVYSTASPGSFDPQAYIRANAGDNPYRSANVPGFGVVREVRRIEVPKGIGQVRFTDVAAHIDPTTVAFSDLSGKGTRVLEQNFEFDLVSPAKLLEKYVDQRIDLQWPETDTALRGTLLATDGNRAVIENDGGEISIVPISDARIGMGELPGGLITRPTLVWKLDSATGGERRIETSYQTAGLTWRADYNITLDADSSSANLTAWVTLMNLSGASYENARLKLVAGDVQRVTPPAPTMRRGMMAMEDSLAAGANGFEEQAFFEYHLYTLPRRTDVRMNSTQQFTLFPPVRGFTTRKVLLYQGLPGMMRGGWGGQPATNRGFGASSSSDVAVFIEFENDRENGLGMPLPAGKVRLSMANPNDGSLEFIGEDLIDHTPRNETVRLKAGNAFDVRGSRTQTDFKVDTGRKTMTETWSIELRNQKDVAQEVIVREPLYRWRNWELRSSDDYEKLDSRVVQWTVEVPAEGTRTITYTVVYTW